MYAKIFTSIFDGSMRGHSDLILVFVNMLCHADQDGMVDRHWRAIADETGLDDSRVKAALNALEGPDSESRSRNDDGRRIKRIDPEREWGWQIVNYQHYRALRSADERREYIRDYMRTRRGKQPVNNCKQCKPIAEVEVEVDAEANTELQPGGQQAGSVPDAVITIPLIPSHGEYGIIQKQVDQWTELFPGVQVMQTLREIKAWNVANPSRRKTRRGIEKHVVGWLSREQNKA